MRARLKFFCFARVMLGADIFQLSTTPMTATSSADKSNSHDTLENCERCYLLQVKDCPHKDLFWLTGFLGNRFQNLVYYAWFWAIFNFVSDWKCNRNPYINIAINGYTFSINNYDHTFNNSATSAVFNVFSKHFGDNIEFSSNTKFTSKGGKNFERPWLLQNCANQVSR